MRYFKRKFAAFPVYEWLEVILLLAFAGGFLESYTYVTRGGVFANAQTANLLLIAIGAAHADAALAVKHLVPVLFFTAGVVLSELFLRLGRKRSTAHWHSYVLLVEIAALTAAAFLPAGVPDMYVNALASFCAAIQFDNFRKVESNTAATAFCTGNLRSATEHAFHGIVEHKKGALKTSGKYFAIILCFLGGGVAGYSASRALGGYAALVISAVLLLVLAAIAAGHVVRGRTIACRPLEEKELPAAQALILESFTKYVAPAWTADGAERFRRFLYDAPRADGYLFYGLYAGGMLKAALAAQADGAHVAAFFTKAGEQRRGYGGRLMRWFLENAGADAVTVNASDYGLPAYRKLGFRAAGARTEQDGMAYTPMIYDNKEEEHGKRENDQSNRES